MQKYLDGRERIEEFALGVEIHMGRRDVVELHHRSFADSLRAVACFICEIQAP